MRKQMEESAAAEGARREPGGRPERPPGGAVGSGFRLGASARWCCVCCAERISSPCRGS